MPLGDNVTTLNSKIGWRATAGSKDKNELIYSFKHAILEEVEQLKKGKGGKSFHVKDGKKVYSASNMNIYRFKTHVSLNDELPVTVIINNEYVDGQIVSSDPEGVNIAIQADYGEIISKAKINYSAYKLLEALESKLEKARTGSITLNIKGAMKLFGFFEPKYLDEPVEYLQKNTFGYKPNTEQKIAIQSSLSQEITFIWGPPGTGKTKTLSIILSRLIAAGKSVLLTSHTNAAVDEILKKFIENKDNDEIVTANKIIRYGVPSDPDSKLQKLLIVNMVQKEKTQKKFQIKQINEQIKDINKRTTFLSEFEEKRVVITFTLGNKKRELEKTSDKIHTIESNISTLTLEKNDLISEKIKNDQFLEKAKNSNMIKRFFSGLNVEEFQKKIKQIDIRLEVIKLKLESLTKENKIFTKKSSEVSLEIEQIATEMKKLLQKYGLSSVEEREKELWDLSQEKKEKEKQIKELQFEIEIIEDKILENAQVIGCTLTRAYLDSKIIKRRFDVLIIDEASMAQLPSIFFVAGLSLGQYIISGDFCQLPPIAISSKEETQTWLKRDIFNQSGVIENIKSMGDDKRLVMLKEQYRMHPDICKLINVPLYDGQLRTNEAIKDERCNFGKLNPLPDKPLIFCNTAAVNPIVSRAANSFSRISPYSAILCANLAEIIIQDAGSKKIDVTVGIITPYSAQAKLISKVLEDKQINEKVVASTIHKFQGKEKSCIIFDLVEGPPFVPGILTKGAFDSEQGKLINVAISRAKDKFILVGNGEYIKEKFNPEDAIAKILNEIQTFGEVVESTQILPYKFGKSSKEKIFSSKFSFLDEKNFYPQFIKDISLAKKSILVLSPFIASRRLKTLLDDFKKAVEREVKISIITRKPDFQGSNKKGVKNLFKILENSGVKVIFASSKIGMHEKFHEKMGVIDESVFYHGSLNILSQSNSSESMIVIRGKKTVKELIRNLDLNEILKKFKNATGGYSQKSIINMIEKELLKKNDPILCSNCGNQLRLSKHSDGFYFICPNSINKKCGQEQKVSRDEIEFAIKELDINCEKCKEGRMTYKDGKFGPFLGCDYYYSKGCTGKKNFEDELIRNNENKR